MIKVHHLNQSRSTRVLWLLEELKLPYEVVHHERDAQTRLAPASLGEVHPLNKAPVIEHNGLVLCESGAVMEYLLDQADSSSLRPEKGDAHYYQYLEWSHFAEGSLALPVITTLLMQMEQREGTAPMDGYIAKELALDLGYIEATLAKQAFFAGPQFSAADIMMTITLEFAANLNLLDGKPHIQQYLSKVQSREAYQAARKQG
ncbi:MULTISPECIES: glutathione S-transferase family protein [unclassified Pseudoalteromonas]|uniref:glutathione S-transferase family protein n=1 Tax=unclassified Pseudoalteromonas TaxID=194690 RepID=UPI002097ED63|nr:glutathione S-transferase family protein [Pseudoalteromonas sp. XMcav2-N]MCO7187489.1 glutathione S-transferase family protein [Pseudoalteromonas sp. XMcav2-N]